MEIFDIITVSLILIIGIGITIIYVMQYKKLLKSSEGNGTSVDLLLNSYADELVELVTSLLKTYSIKRVNYKTENEYRKAIVEVVSDDVLDFLNTNTKIPDAILNRITDEILSSAILKVIDYIESIKDAKLDIVEDFIEEEEDISTNNENNTSTVDITKDLERLTYDSEEYL